MLAAFFPDRARDLLDLAHVEAAGDDFVGEPLGIVMADQGARGAGG